MITLLVLCMYGVPLLCIYDMNLKLDISGKNICLENKTVLDEN